MIKMLSQQDINLTEKELEEIKTKLMLRKSSLISKTPDVIKAIKVTKRSRNWDLVHQSVYSNSPVRKLISPLDGHPAKRQEEEHAPVNY